MKPYLLVFTLATASALCPGSASAQHTVDSVNTYSSLKEVTVSALKFGRKKTEVFQQVDVISSTYIKKANTQNTGDLLASTGNIFVQKSQLGAGSPVIRGFEANRILLVIDGIRMNNAVYRAGHLQNVISVDQNMLDKIEVVSGPFSTLFGSDALGGAIYLQSKAAKPATAGKLHELSGNSFVRYSSANNEKTGHADINLGFQKFGFLTSITYSDFGDLRMGKNYGNKYEGFGQRDQFIQTLGPTRDSLITSSDKHVQQYSGYRQWDIMQKAVFRQNDKITHTVNLQFSNSSNVPRYDRLQDIRNGSLRYAEWYYGPQKRNLYAYTMAAKNLRGLVNEITGTISYQDIKESRQTREYNRHDRFDSRREHINVWGAVVDGRIPLRKHLFTIGADAQWNKVASVADRSNLLTGAAEKLDTRYPDGKNILNNYAVYAQHSVPISGRKWVLSDGIRLQIANLNSFIKDNSFFNLPVTNIQHNTSAVTGFLGLVYNASQFQKYSIGISSGFRSPNLDDVAKVFESGSSLQRVVVPNADLKPEYTYTFDVGMERILYGKVKIESSVFFTLFRNAITLAAFKLNGNDSLLYNGAMCQVVANQNSNKAFIYGLSTKVSANITNNLSVIATVNYTYGRFKTNEHVPAPAYQKLADGQYALSEVYARTKPLDHIPPLFGKASVQYNSKKVYGELFIDYNGWKRLDDFNADGEDNAQYATKDGSPSWFTINARAGIPVRKHLECQLGIENIFDRNYRVFASGISAPGRNVIVAIRTSF